MRIKTITTEYDQEEDRIRLSVADKDGHSRTLWLTRRLAERLVPALIQGLTVTVEQEEEQPVAPEEIQAAQMVAQLTARLSQKQMAPVRPDGEAWQGLVFEINVNSASDGSRVLVFKCKGTDAAELPMTQTQLRQWLQLLQRMFAQGQWSEAVWPAWLRKDALK